MPWSPSAQFVLSSRWTQFLTLFLRRVLLILSAERSECQQPEWDCRSEGSRASNWSSAGMWVCERQPVPREYTRDTRGVQDNYWRDHEVWGGQQADLFARVCVLMCGRQWRRERMQEQLLNWCAPPANMCSVLMLAGPGGTDLWQSCLCWCTRWCSSLWEATSEKSRSS